MKTPKFFRTAATDQEKLTRARSGRDKALRQAAKAMEKLIMFSALVSKYERVLGDVLPPGPAPKPRKPTHWLDHALDQGKGQGLVCEKCGGQAVLTDSKTLVGGGNALTVNQKIIVCGSCGTLRLPQET